MSTLLQLRNRIRTAKNVGQITKAMAAVATAQLRNASRIAEVSSFYAKMLGGMLARLAGSTEYLSHPFMQQRPLNKAGLVVVTSDKGLAGPYNDNVLKRADAFLSEAPAGEMELILVGKKATSHYRRSKVKIRHQLENWSGKLSEEMMLEFVKEITKGYLTRGLDAIWLIYTNFESMLSQKVVIEKLLPIDPHSEHTAVNYIFEPDPQDLLDALLPRYCSERIQCMFDEAYASELASRAFSMRKANKNAKEMLENLVLMSNKIRQAGITREMIEIAAGIEGVS